MISEQKKIQQRVDEQIRELEDSFYEERFWRIKRWISKK
jgi:hypothetical protein